MRICLFLAVFALLAALAVLPATAEEEEASHGEQGFHRNHLALFLGATTAESETGFTSGLDYEFRPLDYLGFGIIAEYIAGDLREWVIVLPVFSHPNRDAVGGWKLIIGPGLEIGEHSNDFLVRLGLAYGFHAEGWTIAPEFNGDLVYGEWNWVYGVSIGRGF